MARSVASVVENNFSKGLITEASALNFPENACIETYNCIFNEDGTVERRQGINYEEDYTLTNVTRSNSVFTEYLWENAGGNVSVSFVVQQVGNILKFFRVFGQSSLSDDLETFFIDLNDYKLAGAPSISQTTCQYATGSGYLFVVGTWFDPLYISFDGPNNNLIVTQITIQERDLAGLEDNLSVSETPTDLTKEHEYNLLNQGWQGNVDAVFTPDGPDKTEFTTNYGLVAYYKAQLGVYPSNAESWWEYKNDDENFDWRQVKKTTISSTKAPRGHYILNAFYKDRASVGVPGLEVEISLVRPTSVAFFAGRVWYAGIFYGQFNQKVYFSQVVLDDKAFGKCYQENDPTDEDNNDLLPSDGGVLTVQEIGKIVKLIPLGNSLFIFADNGIWAIEGSTGQGFAANDYSVRKISSVKTSSNSSFVLAEGSPIWWTQEDIYTLVADSQTGAVSVAPLTDKTIRSFLLEIPKDNKLYVKGDYSPLLNQIQWLYRLENATTIDESYDFDHILVFNTKTGAFFPWSIDTSGVKINGIICVKGLGSQVVDEDVVDSLGVTVTNSLGEDVTVKAVESIANTNSFKYTATKVQTAPTYYLTYAEEGDTRFVDFFDNDDAGKDYSSYFITGYKIRGDAQRKWQSNYVWVYLENNVNASLLMQGIWDYATSDLSGKFTNPQQVYNSRGSSFGNHMAKRRIRGSGLVLQLKFYSETGKPFKLIGWSSLDTGDTIP